MLTESQIRQMMPLAGARLDPHIPYIGPALEEGGITRPKDIAAFMAHLAHESGEYRWMEEIASGDAYDTRTDLGNTPEVDGDGRIYKGRGPIQLTGTDAYRECGLALGIDLIDDRNDPDDDEDPDKLKRPQYATASAVWFWTKYKRSYSRRFNRTVAFLPVFAQMNWFWATTKGVNGGYTHINERLRYWNRNQEILGIPVIKWSLVVEKEIIRRFQIDVGLSGDGDAGPDTAVKADEWLKCNL